MPQPTAPSLLLDADHPQVDATHSSRVQVIGVVDAFTARDVARELLPLATSRPRLVVDLTETRLLTSAGLTMLLHCSASATERGHRFHLRASESTLVQRVLDFARVPHEVVPT